MQRLAGKLAVVTGAAAGIGRACALRLAQEGARLALLDRDATGLREVEAALRENQATVLALEVDCVDESAVVAAFERIRTDAGAIDILVNNVGQSARERAREFHE